MATEFVRTYFNNPHRGYGNAVIEVFKKLKKSNFVNPLQPAKEQFNGIGSFGNGGAMRVAPISLFYHNKTKDIIINAAKLSAEVTHSNREAINGTILQALTIHHVLNATHFNIQQYLNSMKAIMNEIESLDDDNNDDNINKYCTKLNEVERLLSIDPSDEQVINKLGNDVRALNSVPTAIYSFLRSYQCNMDTNNLTQIFRSAIEYSISLGGDSDTIGSMTGAIVGAFCGNSVISENLLIHCEGYEVIEKICQKLYEASQSN